MIFIKALNTNFVKEPMTCTVLKYVKILELSCLALAIVANIHAALMLVCFLPITKSWTFTCEKYFNSDACLHNHMCRYIDKMLTKSQLGYAWHFRS